MIDRAAAVLDIRQHLREQVAELVYDDAAANLTEVLFRTCNAPAIFVLIRYTDATELVPGLRTQKIELEIVAGLVTQSVASPSGAIKGPKGVDVVGPKVIKALHWWKPSWALEKVKFRGEEPGVTEAGRLGTEFKFATSIHETFS